MMELLPRSTTELRSDRKIGMFLRFSPTLNEHRLSENTLVVGYS